MVCYLVLLVVSLTLPVPADVLVVSVADTYELLPSLSSSSLLILVKTEQHYVNTLMPFRTPEPHFYTANWGPLFEINDVVS